MNKTRVDICVFFVPPGLITLLLAQVSRDKDVSASDVRSGDKTHYLGSGVTPTLRGLAPIINTSHIVLVNRLHLTWNAFLFFTMYPLSYGGLSVVRKRHYLFLLLLFTSHKLTNFCVSLPLEPFAGFLRQFTPTVFLPWRNYWSWKRSRQELTIKRTKTAIKSPLIFSSMFSLLLSSCGNIERWTL